MQFIEAMKNYISYVKSAIFVVSQLFNKNTAIIIFHEKHLSKNLGACFKRFATIMLTFGI